MEHVMWLVFVLGSLFIAVNAHNDKIQSEADLQTALMPQELNPEFSNGKLEPWRAVLPLLRPRRDVFDKPLQPSYDNFGSQLKKYSRIVACVVLPLAALVEIVLYILDSYFT